MASKTRARIKAKKHLHAEVLSVAQSTSNLLMAGRHAEREDIKAEVEGRLNGTRGWFSKNPSAEVHEVLSDLLRWLEARG